MKLDRVPFRYLKIGERFEIPFHLPRNPAGFCLIYTRSSGQSVVDEHGHVLHWPASENSREVIRISPSTAGGVR